MTVRFIYFLLLLGIIGTVDVAWAADMNAWLDRSRIGEAETVQLTLEVQGQVNSRPDTTPLDNDFDVLGISTSSRMSIVNGRTDVRTTWTLTLSPKRNGTLTIPALRAGNYQSAPVTLEVSSAPAPAPGSNADILVETELEPSAPYVQEQVLYTVRLLHTVPITGGQLTEPEPENTLVQRLGEDRKYAVTRNGRRYQVIERRYALFPQASGKLELAAPVFNGEIPDESRQRSNPFERFFDKDPFLGRNLFDDLTTPTRRVRVRGESAGVEILPRPDTAQGVHWLPAQRLELKGEWQQNAAEIKVGEPVTLVLELDVQGLTGGQLPSLAPEVVDGFRIYPDQAQRQTDVQDSGVTGQLVQKIAFMPEREGQLVLPAIELKWWDTQADLERVAILPGRILEVSLPAGQSKQASAITVPSMPAGDVAMNQAVVNVPGPDASVAESQTPRARSSGPWPWVSAALAAGWLLTLVLWWWRARGLRAVGADRQQSASTQLTTGAARRQFLVACQAGDAITARRTLLAWAAAHWPAEPPRGLDALAQRLHDPEVRAELAELNRTIYKESGSWDGTRLAKYLTQLPEVDSEKGKSSEVLAPLYP